MHDSIATHNAWQKAFRSRGTFFFLGSPTKGKCEYFYNKGDVPSKSGVVKTQNCRTHMG